MPIGCSIQSFFLRLVSHPLLTGRTHGNLGQRHTSPAMNAITNPAWILRWLLYICKHSLQAGVPFKWRMVKLWGAFWLSYVTSHHTPKSQLSLQISLCLQGKPKLRRLYIAFFGARGTGTNGLSARFKKNFYFDDVTKNKDFEWSSDLRTHIARFPDGECFFTIGRWTGFSFLSLLRNNHQILHAH